VAKANEKIVEQQPLAPPAAAESQLPAPIAVAVS